MPRVTAPTTTGGDIRGTGYVYDPKGPTRGEPMREMPTLPQWIRTLMLFEHKAGKGHRPFFGMKREAFERMGIREQLKKYNPRSLNYFWANITLSMDKFAPWQAKLLLQYIFTTGAVPSGAPGERSMMGKIITGQQGRGTGKFSYSELIGNLAQKAGSYKGGMPEGWEGITSLMYAREKFGSFWNPFGSAGGFVDALIVNDPLYSPTNLRVPWTEHPVKTIMKKWGVDNLKGLDSIGSMIGGTWAAQSGEKRAEFEMERRSERGGGGLGGLFGMATSLALPMAIGGTLGSAGKALASTGKPFLASIGGVAGKMGQGMAPGIWEDMPGGFEGWFKGPMGYGTTGEGVGPPRIPGTKDIKFPYIAGGEKGVPGYWPEKWKKESLWEKMWGEYPEEMREELRQSLFEKNPYGYGDLFWTPPSGMRAWGF